MSQLPRLLGRVARGRGVTACCNAVFVWESEISRPVTRIEPVAAHNGEIFDARGAFDVNPVIWHQLSRGGFPVRGGNIAGWNLDPEAARLQDWTRQNLHDYWEPLARHLAGGDRPLRARHVEWRLLGPARMHATLATGEVISKDEAGRRALESFPEHAPILRIALARLRRTAIPSAPPRAEWRSRTIAAMRSIMAKADGRGID